MHHTAATGRNSYNLDSWMLSREVNLACFRARAADTDVAIVEGVMGLYDGRDGRSDVGSTAEMAKLLSAPVLLVLDCWTLARSAAAIIRGYTTFDPALDFAGVVFNKVGSPAHTAWLTEAVQATESGIQVLGGLPKVSGIQLPQRHLGIQLTEDEGKSLGCIQQLADLVELYINLDAVLESAGVCEPLNSYSSAELSDEASQCSSPLSPASPASPPGGKYVRIGIARDEAFCFYYQANLNLLEEAGAELVYFSPLRDLLPPRLDAIIFGGGHPEIHAERLTANKPMLYAVRAFALAGGIVYGECGGLMYLSQAIEGSDGEVFPMCGVFPFAIRTQPLKHEGYVKVTPRSECVLFPATIGEIRGQVYHSSEIFYPSGNQVTDCPRGLTMKIDYDEAREELEGFMQGNAMASFVHLHFGSNPTMAPAFVERCRTNTTKAAAVAAASASAVAGAGPVAAAAAGAAAAAAVAAALGEASQELVPYHSSITLTELEPPGSSTKPQYLSRSLLTAQEEGSHTRIFERMRSLSPQAFSDVMFEGPQAGQIRRSESFDLGRSTSGNGRLVRSESEVCISTGASQCYGNDSLNVGHHRGHHRGNSFSEYSDHIQHETTRMRPSDHVGKSETVAYNGNHHSSSGLPMVRVTSSTNDQSIRKSDASESNKETRATLEKLQNGHTPKKYALDAGRQQLSSKVGKPMNAKRFPERIISLLPSATEILLDIGVGDRLIAITDMCDRPLGVKSRRHIVCSSKVDVGSMSSKNVDFALKALAAKKESHCRLDVSWLSKAKPDLIISQDTCEQCDMHDNTLTTMLAKLGIVSKSITKLVTFSPKTITDMLASIMTLGEAVGLYSEACLLVDSLRARLRRVAASVANQDRPRVLLLQGIDPLQLGGHWAFEMVTLAGGSEGLQKPGCPPETFHFQRLIAYAPEVLILAPRWSSLDRSLAEVEILGRIPEFWSIPAVERREVYICDHSCFSFPGPRLVEGVELLAHILHPSVSMKMVKEAVLKFSLPVGQSCRPEDLTHHFHAFQ
ncbi:uncharacterized protein [Physcomitrium patens]|nr:uncharacterized protein LOC112282540 isoform X3 [Physcomitrium patens]|eukprot:XP_024376002.1 uncharacterized protein LOC112282540 isoform X3 [Physcomitrella patens]